MLAGLMNGDHLGMTGGILIGLARVRTAADHDSILHYERTDRHLAPQGGFFCQLQRLKKI